MGFYVLKKAITFTEINQNISKKAKKQKEKRYKKEICFFFGKNQ